MSMIFNVGRLPAGAQAGVVNGGARALVVLGDFSTRSGRVPPRSRAELAAIRPLALDVDTLDTVIGTLAKDLRLELGGGGVAEPRSLDDLHPDALFDRLPVFAEMASLRRRLDDPRSFASAAAEVRSWQPAAPAAPAATAAAEPAANPADDISWLLGRPAGSVSGAAPAGRAASPLDAYLRAIVAPHIVAVAAPSPDAPALVAAVDAALTQTMRQVLHDPALQALEAAWRSLEFLVRRIETDNGLRLIVIDMSAEELLADLAAEGELQDSALYQLLIEQPALDAHRPRPAALIGCHGFDVGAAHAEALGRLAQLAERAGVPLICGVSPDAVARIAAGGEGATLAAADAAAWQALCRQPEAAHLMLVAPRFLLREPYGKRSHPIEHFAFEELEPGADAAALPWGAPALLAAVLLGQHVAENGLDEAPGEPLTIDDLPTMWRVDSDGETVAVPCTELQVNDRSLAALQALGITPLLARRGEAEARLAGWWSVAGQPLAGPWAEA